MKRLTIAIIISAISAVKNNAFALDPVKKKAVDVEVVTMEKLISEAADNTMAAERKYKGKRFQISGIVMSFGQLPSNDIFVELTDASETVSLIAHLPPTEIDRAEKLRRAQIVSLQCVGLELRTQFDLLNCKIIPR